MVFQWLVLVLWGFSAAYAQTSNCQEDSVRLVGTLFMTFPNAGRVEVCRSGVWGTVCADSPTTPWSEKNAQVVCRQLGYSGALNSILQDSVDSSERPSSNTPIHYRSVHCSGEEDGLIDCPDISTATASCSHAQDAYIVCRPLSGGISPVHTASPQHGDIRLVADPDNGEGAVEFYHRSFGWSGICPDSNWGTSEAVVACRQLGYETGTSMTYTSNVFSQRILSISDCNERTDISLQNCSVSSSSFSCFSPSNNYAGIQCSNGISTTSTSQIQEGSVRLFGGNRTRGIVEVFYDGRWGPICSSGWGSTDARVVCAEMGFNRDDATAFTSSGFGIETNLKPIWLTDLRCTSSDRQLTRDCEHRTPIGLVDCPNSFAGADCTAEPSRSNGFVIASIVISTSIVVIGGLIGLWYGYGKEKWRTRRRHLTRLQRELEESAAENTTNFAAEVEVATTTARLQSLSRSRSSSSSDSETEQPPERPDAELTKAAPPSYHASSNFPTGDPLKAPPTDLPPPYPGPPTAPASAGDPPAGLGFSPVASNYQGSPPTNPTPYPPEASGLELAYTHQMIQQVDDELPYPTGDSSAYSPNITTPYPVDATLEEAD